MTNGTLINTPRIYVASLSDYNAGELHGIWIDVDQMDAEDMQEEINKMLLASNHPNTVIECDECVGTGKVPDPAYPRYKILPLFVAMTCPHCKGEGSIPTAEEWEIHDIENLPDFFGEGTTLEEIEEFIENANMVSNEAAYLAYCNYQEEIADYHDFDDCFRGEWDSAEEFGRYLLEDVDGFTLPDHLADFFDYEGYAENLFRGEFSSVDSSNYSIYVFEDNC